mgnify:CR=1 FL=1
MLYLLCLLKPRLTAHIFEQRGDRAVPADEVCAFLLSGLSVTKPYFSNVQNPASLSDDADLDATEADTPSHSDRFFTLTGTLPVR